MIKTLTRREEKVVDNMVRIAGSERAFEEAIYELEDRLGRAPDGNELLDYLLDRRIEMLQAQIERMQREQSR